MFQMVSVLLTLILLSTFFKFKEKAKKKYGGSLAFQIIDREYSIWYKRDHNGSVMNKQTASMFEVDKVIFKLKERFKNQGVSKDQLKDYLDFLSNNEPKKIGIYSILLAIFGYLGSNTFLKSLLPELNNIADVSKLFNTIADTFNKNKEIVLLILYLFFFIAIVVLLSYISYKLATADSMYVKTQKIYVLKRTEKIWDFQENPSVRTNEDARTYIETSGKSIFVNLIPSKSKFDEDFDRAIGDTFKKNYEFFKSLPIVNLFKWQVIKEWILGMFLPVALLVIVFVLNYLIVSCVNQLPLILLIGLFALTVYAIYMFMLIYMTQIDKQNKVPTEQPTLSPGSDKTTTVQSTLSPESNEATTEQPTLSPESNEALTGQSTSSSESELMVLEQNGSAKQSESQVNSEKKNRENDRKMKIKCRSINNKWIHFSFVILMICSISLSILLTYAVGNEPSIFWLTMVGISVLLIHAAEVIATYYEIDNNSQ